MENCMVPSCCGAFAVSHLFHLPRWLESGEAEHTGSRDGLWLHQRKLHASGYHLMTAISVIDLSEWWTLRGKLSSLKLNRMQRLLLLYLSKQNPHDGAPVLPSRATLRFWNSSDESKWIVWFLRATKTAGSTSPPRVRCRPQSTISGGWSGSRKWEASSWWPTVLKEVGWVCKEGPEESDAGQDF